MQYKGFGVLVLLLLTLAGLGFPLRAEASQQHLADKIELQEYRGFADVGPDEWYVTSGHLDYVVDHGLLAGYDDATFGPQDELRRGQVAVILHRMAGEPDVESDAFDDVDYSLYYGPAIRWARAVGVASGDAGTNNFGPERSINREEFAAMLARYAKLVAGADVTSDCAKLDATNGSEEVSSWAREVMGWAADTGILTGIEHPDGSRWVEPKGTTLRCQAAKMIAVLHRDILKLGADMPDTSAPTSIEYDESLVLTDIQADSVVQDNSTISITTDDATEGIEVGDTVMLDESESLPFGAAVEVTKITSDGATTVIEGDRPKLDDIYDELVVNETFGLDDLAAGAEGIQTQSLIDGFTIPVEHKFGRFGSVSGELTITKLDGHFFVVPLLFTNYVDIGFDIVIDTNVDVDLKALPSEDRRFKLWKDIPLKAVKGTGLYLTFYMNVDIYGQVTFDARVKAGVSAECDFGEDLDVDSYSDAEFTNMEATVNGKIGPSAVVSLQLGGWNMAEVGLGTGAGTETETVLHPDLTCTDLDIWLYLKANAALLSESGKTELSRDFDFWDESNSPVRLAFHIENGDIVPECTWSPEEDVDPDETEDPDEGDQDDPLPTLPSPIMQNAREVEFGDEYSAAIDNEGTLWMWGKNNNHQLGDGVGEDQLKPIEVMKNVKSVSLGYEHTLAVTNDGKLWAWGINNIGECGIAPGDGTYRITTPTLVMDNIVYADAGTYNSAAIDTNGDLWVWGSNRQGQLGNGTATGGYMDTYNAPHKAMSNVVAVSVGNGTIAAIDGNGVLWTWGAEVGRMRDDGTISEQWSPVRIMDSVQSVSVGDGHIAAIKNDGSLWTWGGNMNGELGTGSLQSKTTPTKVMDDVKTASAGDYFTAAIDSDGVLWTWGSNYSGQLGDGTTADKDEPVKIMNGAIDVACGSDHLGAIDKDGAVRTWGANRWGALGNGGTAW